jgi:hypothetical protein
MLGQNNWDHDDQNRNVLTAGKEERGERMKLKAERFIWGANRSGSNYRFLAYSSSISKDIQGEIERFVSLGSKVHDHPVGTTHHLHTRLQDGRHVWIRSEIIHPGRGMVYRAHGCVLESAASFALRGDWYLLDSMMPDVADPEIGSSEKFFLNFTAENISLARSRAMGCERDPALDKEVCSLLAGLGGRHRQSNQPLTMDGVPPQAASLLRSLVSCLPPMDRLNLCFTTAAFQSRPQNIELDLVIDPVIQAPRQLNVDQKSSAGFQVWLNNLETAKIPPYYGISVIGNPSMASRLMTIVRGNKGSMHPISVATREGLSVDHIFTHPHNSEYEVVRRYRRDVINFILLQSLKLSLAQNKTLDEILATVAGQDLQHDSNSLLEFGLSELTDPPFGAGATLCTAVRITIAILLHRQGVDAQPLLGKITDPAQATDLLFDNILSSDLLTPFVQAWFLVLAKNGYNIDEFGGALLDQFATYGRTATAHIEKPNDLPRLIWYAVCRAIANTEALGTDLPLIWYQTVSVNYGLALREERLKYAMVQGLYSRMLGYERETFRHDFMAATLSQEDDPSLALVAGQSIKHDPHLLWALASLLGQSIDTTTIHTSPLNKKGSLIQSGLIVKILKTAADRSDLEIQAAGPVIVSFALSLLLHPTRADQRDIVHLLVDLLSVALRRPLPTPELSLLVMSLLSRHQINLAPMREVWPRVRLKFMGQAPTEKPASLQFLIWHGMALSIEDALRFEYHSPERPSHA